MRETNFTNCFILNPERWLVLTTAYHTNCTIKMKRTLPLSIKGLHHIETARVVGVTCIFIPKKLSFIVIRDYCQSLIGSRKSFCRCMKLLTRELLGASSFKDLAFCGALEKWPLSYAVAWDNVLFSTVYCRRVLFIVFSKQNLRFYNFVGFLLCRI